MTLTWLAQQALKAGTVKAVSKHTKELSNLRAAHRALRAHFRPIDVVGVNWSGRPHDIAVYFTAEDWAQVSHAMTLIQKRPAQLITEEVTKHDESHHRDSAPTANVAVGKDIP